MNPHVPISSFWGRARTELLGWIISFPRAFCHKKNLFISEGSRHVTASSVSTSYHMSWCRASHLKGFQGKRVRGFYTFFSPDLSQSRVIIHSSGAMRDDVRMTFSLSCFVVADPRWKGLQSLTSAVFSVQHTSPAKKRSERGFSFSHLDSQVWATHDSKINTHTIMFNINTTHNTSWGVRW